MAKTQKETSRNRTESRLVAGTYGGDRKTQSELYAYCLKYFRANYRAVFFAPETEAEEIFQNSFVTLWENIERGKIRTKDGMVTDKSGEPLKCSLLTYFMGIARIKYREWAREHTMYTNLDNVSGQDTREETFAYGVTDMLYDPDDNRMIDIIADIISHMSERCGEILSKFYYERKDLDTILQEIPTIDSKNALKTKKHKCMESLRTSAKEIYNKFLNS